MRAWKRGAISGLAAVLLATGLSAVSTVGAASAATATCPLNALKKASKPVEITMWHWMTVQNETTLQKLTDAFNSSQSAVKVKLVNHIDWDQTLADYKAGLGTGNLPDIVQLQETDQQQAIDTQSVLPASACAKADHYSFADFLPRVTSYYTVRGTQYGMPFNTSGPVLYYNKKAFSTAGLDPNSPPKTLAAVRAAAEKLKAAGVATPLGLKVDPFFMEHWTAMANNLFANDANGRKARASKTVFDTPTGRQLFNWMSGMVKDGLAATNPETGPNSFDDLFGIRSQSHAMAIDTSAAFSSIKLILSAGKDPNIELGVAPMPFPGAKVGKGGVIVQGGALYMVNKSTPAKQAASWQFLKFLDQPANVITWAIGSGYMPIRQSSASSAAMQAYWVQNPGSKVAYDQLLAVPSTVATAGAVIGNSRGVKDAIRDAENSMFLEGKDPKAALTTANQNATTAIDDYNTRLGG
jgi:sn-glycerol 3-phosphate transport system substrate-binding protein